MVCFSIGCSGASRATPGAPIEPVEPTSEPLAEVVVDAPQDAVSDASVNPTAEPEADAGPDAGPSPPATAGADREPTATSELVPEWGAPPITPGRRGPPSCSDEWKKTAWPKIKKRQAERKKRCAVMQCEDRGALIQRNLREQIARSTRDCFEMYLRQDPALSGRVVWKLSIDRYGCLADPEVAEVDIESGSDPDARDRFESHLETCVLEHLRQRAFPVPDKGAVTYTLPIILRGE